MRTFIAAGSVIGLILAVPSLARSEFCPINSPSGMVALGVLAPISGPSAAFGQSAAKAIEVAVRSLNTVGGLLGIRVERMVGDDRCDAGMATTVAKRLIEQDKVNFVIGPLCQCCDGCRSYLCQGGSHPIRTYDNDSRSNTAISGQYLPHRGHR